MVQQVINIITTIIISQCNASFFIYLILAFKLLQPPPFITCVYPLATNNCLAAPLLIPDAQQVIIVWFLSFKYFLFIFFYI